MSDAFEQLIADLFWAEGYWVRTGVKVDLTRNDKQRMELPSCPRWEIDLVAHRPGTGELLVIECKSYLDSGGVHAPHFDPEHKLAGRYKLFNKPEVRKVVMARLRDQLVGACLCAPEAAPKLCLAYGHASPANERKLRRHFDENGWTLYGPEWIEERLQTAADGAYENSTAAIVAKLLLRKPSSAGLGVAA